MKKPAPIFRGESKNGMLALPRGGAFENHLRSIEGPVDVIVRRRRDKRSLDANRYYWGVVLTVFAEHTGYDPEELHEVLKTRFLAIPSGDPNRVVQILSTAELDSEQFAIYIDQVIRLAAEMDCVIPAPQVVDI